MDDPKGALTRRHFLQNSLGTGVLLVGGGARVLPLEVADTQSPENPPNTPWYRRAYIWGQTNITERDPVRYDIAWWREQWQRTQVQALIINAGGIVAYYPSKFPLHHRAEFLKDRGRVG